MKYFLSLTGLLFLAQVTVAQHTTWSVNVTPTISYRIAELSSDDESVRNGERPSHMFDFGLQLRTQLSDRMYLGTGLMYAQRGYANTYVAGPYQRPLDRGYTIDFIQDYLDIPFFLTYNIAQNDQFQWYTLGGINNGILLRERNEVSVRAYEQTVREVPADVQEMLKEPYLGASRQYNLGLIVGFGVRARVDAKTFVGLEAISKLIVTPLQDYISGTQRRSYTIGLNFRFVRTL